jgi:glycosyltransferase involved in cell wall biosynthesis
VSSDASRHRLAILIFSPYLTPHVGGVESFVSELSEVMLRGTEVERITVFTAHLPPTSPPRETLSESYTVVRYPAVEPIPNFPVPKLWTASFWRALRSAGPRSHDLLVSHTRFFVSSALALACARALRRPLLHVEHGSDYVQLSGRASRAFARAYDSTIGRLVLRQADAVVAVSRAAAGFVRRLARREAYVIYRGMWPHRLASLSADRRVLDFARQRLVVSFVGRLIDGKGVSDLIRAFAQVAGNDSVLCLVGDGPRRAELESIAATLGIRDQVLFLGYLDEGQALSAILASDVVVNPSYTEGLPTTVLEAAFLGRAVLATDVGGTDEVLKDGRSGILVAPRDINSLARQLERLLRDPLLRQQLGSAAQIDVKNRFSWERSAQRFTDVVWSTIRQSGS